MVLDHRMALVMIVIGQIGGKRACKGIGGMGLTVGVQGPVHHGDRGLNDQHGEQHDGQSRHVFPKPTVQMLKQGSLARVARASYSSQAAPRSMRHYELRIAQQACHSDHLDDQQV